MAPALGSTLFFSLFFLFLFGHLEELWNIAAQSLFSLLGIGNIGAVIYSPNYFQPHPNPFLHIWSLAVEVQIYIFFPLVLVLSNHIWRKGNLAKNQNLVLAFLFTISLIVSILPILYNSPSFDNFIYYNFVPRIWEFLLGGILSLNKGRLGLIIKNFRLIYWLSLVSILCCLFFPIRIGSHLLLFILLPSAVFLIDSNYENPFKFFAAPLQHIGDRSYSIYLVHLPLLYLSKYVPGVGAGEIQNFLVLIAVFLSYALGAAQFYLVENRFRMETSRIDGKRNNSVFFVALLFVVFPLFVNVSMLVSIKANFKPFISDVSPPETRDKRLLFNRECMDKDLELEICELFISNDAPTVFLVGDSQAYAAADGVSKAINSLNLNFSAASASGCPFLESDSTGPKSFDCNIFKERVWNYILSEKPKLVVLANRTNAYLEPELHWRTLMKADGSPAKSSVEATEIYKASLVTMSDKLQKIGSKLVIFQNVLEPKNIGLPESIFNYFLFREEFLSGYSSYSLNSKARDVEAALKDAGSLYLFDPNFIICDGTCGDKVYVRNFFEDHTHLSRSGSIRMFSSFRKELKQFT